MKLGILDSTEVERFGPFKNESIDIIKNNIDSSDSFIEYPVPSGFNNSWDCVYNGEFVYFAPNTGGNLYKFNPITKDIIQIASGLPLINVHIVGCQLAPNGKIYFTPRRGDSVVIVDPNKNDEVSFIDVSGISGTNKFSAAVLSSNGCLYCIPDDASELLKIDTNTDTYELLNFPFTRSGLPWAGGVLAGNGIIYLIPWDSTEIIKIDTLNDDNMSSFGSLAGGSKWAGGILAPNGCIYCAPAGSSTVLKIDTRDDSLFTFGSFGTSILKSWGLVLLENGFIYTVPDAFTSSIKIDFNTDTATTTGTFPSTIFKWRSGVNVGGTIVCPPMNNGTTILEISNDGISKNFDVEYLKSPYNNVL